MYSFFPKYINSYIILIYNFIIYVENKTTINLYKSIYVYFGNFTFYNTITYKFIKHLNLTFKQHSRFINLIYQMLRHFFYHNCLCSQQSYNTTKTQHNNTIMAPSLFVQKFATKQPNSSE